VSVFHDAVCYMILGDLPCGNSFDTRLPVCEFNCGTLVFRMDVLINRKENKMPKYCFIKIYKNETKGSPRYCSFKNARMAKEFSWKLSKGHGVEFVLIDGDDGFGCAVYAEGGGWNNYPDDSLIGG